MLLALQGFERDREAAAGSFCELQRVALFDCTLCDDIRLRVLVVGRALGIGIDRSLILAALVEEIELHRALVSVLIALASDKPVVAAFGLARYRNVTGRLSLQILTVGPVDGHMTR